jgi:hypothetical protein
MLAAAKGLYPQLGMSVRRSSEDDGVHVLECRLKMRESTNAREGGRDRVTNVPVEIDRDNFRNLWQAAQDSNMLGTPVATANDGNSQSRRRCLCYHPAACYAWCPPPA